MDDRDRARSTASDWWLYRSMSVGERGERVELERGESSRAREAWRGYERVQQTIDNGGDEAIRLILALIDAAPHGEGVVAVGTGPLEDLLNYHGDDLAGLVEQMARRSPDFAAALGLVAVHEGALRPVTADRLARWLPAK